MPEPADANPALRVLSERGVGSVDHALVLGTGLGGLADAVEQPVIVPFANLPGFPQGAVTGHARRIVYGRLHGRRVLILQGRAHYYERGDAAAMAVPIATIAFLRPRSLILTNAAGSLREAMPPGSLAMITDHINLSGANPLIGMEGDGRFVPMVDAYDPGLRARLVAAAASAGLGLGEGVYLWVSGPSFETPAEIRMARLLGADLVGMSTVPEVILARRHGLAVAALSIVTNMGAGLMGGAPSHDETKAVAVQAAGDLARLMRSFLIAEGAR